MREREREITLKNQTRYFAANNARLIVLESIASEIREIHGRTFGPMQSIMQISTVPCKCARINVNTIADNKDSDRRKAGRVEGDDIIALLRFPSFRWKHMD